MQSSLEGTLALWSMPEGECKDSTCLYVLSGKGNGNPLQYSFLENPMDGEAWQQAIYSSYGRKELDMTERLNFHFHFGSLMRLE